MSFTVIWRPDSLNQLAELWAESLDRDGLTAASHRIDVALQSDPLGVGESRMENDRILFEPPLAVWYRVDEPSRMVFVLSVGPFGRTG